MLKIRILLALLCCLPAWAGAQTPARGQLAVKLGFSGPLSGALTLAGKDALNGVQMAIERLNQQNMMVDGKILHFELLVRDDKGNPQTGAAVATELVHAGVRAVLGPYSSGVMLATAKIYDDAGVVALTVASNPKVTQGGLPHIFRIAASDSDMGSKMALYAARSLKLKSVAIIDDGSAYAQGLLNEFQKTAKQNGIQTTQHEVVSDKSSDFRAVLDKIRSGHAGAIFFGGYVQQAIELLKQMKQMDMSVPLLGGDALCSSAMLAQAGNDTYCVQGGAWLTRASDGAVFASGYQSRYGTMPDVYAPTYYDGVLLLAQAMRSANSIDARNFLPVLSRMRYKGITATYEFDARHDIKDSAVTIFRFKEGKLVPQSSF